MESPQKTRDRANRANRAVSYVNMHFPPFSQDLQVLPSPKHHGLDIHVLVPMLARVSEAGPSSFFFLHLSVQYPAMME